MTSLAVQITPQGPVAPTFAQILASLQASYSSIYGSDVNFGPGTQDGAWIAEIATAINDCNNSLIAVYNSFSPQFSQGSALSSLVKINGLLRLSPTFSTVTLTLTGTAGTPIVNGLVGDNQNLGTVWSVPTTTIPLSGTINVVATCTTAGATSAPANTLVNILTPVNGWSTVNNASAASPGAPVETDSALRQRQSNSTALPSQTQLGAISAAVANTPGVTRSYVYENDTDVTNALGIPQHSISAVVAGSATTAAIGTAIALKKSEGTNTYGTTTYNFIDINGLVDPINFYILSSVTVSVTVNVHQQTGYQSTTTALIQQAVAGYVSGLAIGQYSWGPNLNGPASLQGDAATAATGFTQQQLDPIRATFLVTSITQSRTSNPVDTTVTGGPYSAGATSIGVASTADLYVGQIIAMAASGGNFNTVVQSIGVGTVTIAPGVPAANTLANGANVYLISDVKMQFYEAAACTSANVTVNFV
jgi:uncharacterized phage protein gp47/JayE